MTRRVKRLDEVLAAYGADAARWPAEERAGLEDLLRADRAAERLLDEAKALDRVMGFAPSGTVDEALKQRITAAVLADASRESRVVPISAARAARRSAFGVGEGALWPASAMAACFALGLYLGLAGMGANTLGTALELAALDATTDESDIVDFVSDRNDGESEGLI